MNLRTQSILKAAIQHYIQAGTPVSSKELAKIYDFGVKAATVRNELNELTRDGFLQQLHTSGGRVPTDKGYRFFVENTMHDAVASKKILSGRYGELTGALKHGNIRNFVDEVSSKTKLLGVAKKEKEREVYTSGLNDLFNQLDMETKAEMSEILEDFEMLDRRLEEVRNRIFSRLLAPQVFIGKQSPITQSEKLSVILDSFDMQGQRVCIAIIGPKRMDYDKNIKLLQLLHAQIHDE